MMRVGRDRRGTAPHDLVGAGLGRRTGTQPQHAAHEHRQVVEEVYATGVASSVSSSDSI